MATPTSVRSLSVTAWRTMPGSSSITSGPSFEMLYSSVGPV